MLAVVLSIMTFTTVIPVHAESDVISFITPDNNFIIETNYSTSSHYLEETHQDSLKIFTIYNDNNEELESWVFEPTPQVRGTTTTYRHQHKVALGAMSGS